MVFGEARETPGVGSAADFAAAVPADLTGKCLFAAVCWSLAVSFCYCRNQGQQTLLTDSLNYASLSFLLRTVDAPEHCFVSVARLEWDRAKSPLSYLP